MDSNTVLERLKHLASQEDSELNLAEGALLIAAFRDDSLDLSHYLGRLDAMVESVRETLPETEDFSGSVRALTQYLAGEEGFRGNTDEYADVRNSFLNDVLDRKLGIPITLSVLYIEIGTRLGLDVCGLSFPGHFLVRFRHDDKIIVLDPFFGGVSLNEDDLLQRMRRFVPNESQARAMLGQVLRGAPKSEILARMLRNLRELYVSQGELPAALSAADQILAFTPDEPEALRSRADLYYQLEVAHAAAADYQRYLNLSPNAPDADEVRARLIDLGHQQGRLN